MGKGASRRAPTVHAVRIALLLALASPLAAGDLIQQGWDHFYNLEYEQAIQTFEKIIAETPGAPENYNYLAQAVLYRELYRLGALESELLTGNNYFIRTEKIQPNPKESARCLAALEKAIRLAEARLAADPDDEAALYALGSSYALRTNYHFMVQKAWRAAVNDATLARKYHSRVLQLNPANYDAMLIQGAYDYAIGSLPWHARLLSYLAGKSGDKRRGIRTIALVAQKGNLNRVDAQVMLAILYRRERQPERAIRALDPLIRAYPRNYLFRMEKAHMYSDLGKKDEALAILRELEKSARAPMEKIYYAMGDVQFWYNDLEPALVNMKRVTQSADLDLHTGVLAWMRQGQILDLMQRRTEAMDAYRHAIRFAPQTAAAEESKRYLSSPYHRKS
jgi:tetratricopeptide (TPR) repeat protein